MRRDEQILNAGIELYEQRQFSLALQVLRPQADGDDPVACFYSGRILELGLAGGKDPAAAATYYERAATRGVHEASNNLGLMYLRGEGVPADISRAMVLIEDAALSGNVDAQLSMAAQLCNVRRPGGPDRPQALAWSRLAARSLDPDAVRNVAAIVAHSSSSELLTAESWTCILDRALSDRSAMAHSGATPEHALRLD
ncbi:MAG: sel1 repeat family protein [Deltaproteobacteria bacterium]|nr:sel1 repeat family protein [Deltaproteobacteria bacterium]